MTREEAIEVYLGLINPHIKEAFEFFTPELAKNDDERIRKYLIEELKAAKSVGELKFIIQQPTREECIAYLEKQKENPEEPKIAFGDWGDKEKKEAIITCLKYMRFIKKITNQEYDDLAKWLDSNLVCNLEIPEGDVTPAEEDGSFNEDKFLERELSAFLQNYDKEYDDDAAVSDVARHFYEIGKKQKEQKPVEKQDYSGLNDLERAILRGFLAAGIENVPVGIIRDTASECVGFLALFEPEPAEWSEEDKDMLNSCISSIEEAKENRYAYKETDGDTSYDHEIDWLKSLRPSWKPSEEQMKAFKNSVEHIPNAYYDHMWELYEQLKKLL